MSQYHTKGIKCIIWVYACMERQYGNHIDSRKVCIIRGALEHHDKHSNTNGINFQIILVSFHKFVVYFEITTRECKSMRYNQKLVLLLLWFCTMQDKLAFFHQKREYIKSLKQCQLPWIYHMYLHMLLEFGWNIDIQNFGCMWLFMFSTYSFSYISKTFGKGG